MLLCLASHYENIAEEPEQIQHSSLADGTDTPIPGIDP